MRTSKQVTFKMQTNGFAVGANRAITQRTVGQGRSRRRREGGGKNKWKRCVWVVCGVYDITMTAERSKMEAHISE